MTNWFATTFGNRLVPLTFENEVCGPDLSSVALPLNFFSISDWVDRFWRRISFMVVRIGLL